MRANSVVKTVVLISLLVLMSCAAPPRLLTHSQLIDNYASFSDQYYSDLTEIEEKTFSRIKQEYSEPEQSYDILVLSGGGPYGAFGAGFLKGWGQIKDGRYKRPKFDSVSGISTGALIAPFAFANTEQSYNQIVQLYRNPGPNLIVARTFFSLLTGNSAFFDATELHRLVKGSVNNDLLEQIHLGHRENRVLLVGATNLDYGLMRVWDLASMVAKGEPDSVKEAVSEKLLASSAIPGAFPPVEINDFLYVDGGASMQVVSGIENRSWLYGDEPANLNFIAPDKPLKIRIWVIINGKLLMEPEVTTPTWSAIATRSLFSLMQGSTLQTLQDIETFTQMMNRLPQLDVQMKYVAIPSEYPVIDSNDLFDKVKMNDLADLGLAMGSESSNWQTRVLRPGAPIVYDH